MVHDINNRHKLQEGSRGYTHEDIHTILHQVNKGQWISMDGIYLPFMATSEGRTMINCDLKKKTFIDSVPIKIPSMEDVQLPSLMTPEDPVNL